MVLRCCPRFTSLSILLFYLSFQIGLGSSSLNECNRPLGVQDGSIANSQLSAQNHYEQFYIGNGKSANMKAECARLNNLLAWCSPASRYSSIYIEIDLTNPVNISGIATQGFSGINAYYVKQYKIAYSSDRVAWKFYSNKEVLAGNTDAQTAVRNTFNPTISARYVRVYPVAYNFRVCMRLELYGWTNCSAKSVLQPKVVPSTTVPEHQTNPTSSVTATLSKEPTRIKETGSAPTSKSVSQPDVFPSTTVPEHQTTPTSSVTATLSKEPTRIKETGPVKAMTPAPTRNTNRDPSSGDKLKEPRFTTTARVPWSVSSQKVSAVAHQDLEPVRVSTRLVVAFSVTAAVMIIFMVPVTIFLIFLRHRRRNRCSKCPNAGDSGIPLTTAVVYEGIYSREFHDGFMYSAPTGKCSADEMNFVNKCAV